MKRNHNEGTKRHALLHADPVRPGTSTLPAVLIVDDSAADAAAATAVLRQCGYAPVWVRDGLDAIEAIRGGSYGCVLLDLRMAVFGGQELVDYLALESPEILARVIVVSGYPKAAESLRGRVHDIVIKPLSLKKLQGVVAACLAQNASLCFPPEEPVPAPS